MGSVFAERFNETIRNLLNRPVFERGDANWIDILPTITKRYNNRIHSSTKATPIQASLKKNEGFVYRSLSDKRKKVKPKFQVNDLDRTADVKKTFPKEVRLTGPINCIKLQKKINDTIPR